MNQGNEKLQIELDVARDKLQRASELVQNLLSFSKDSIAFWKILEKSPHSNCPECGRLRGSGCLPSCKLDKWHGAMKELSDLFVEQQLLQRRALRMGVPVKEARSSLNDEISSREAAEILGISNQRTPIK